MIPRDGGAQRADAPAPAGWVFGTAGRRERDGSGWHGDHPHAHAATPPCARGPAACGPRHTATHGHWSGRRVCQHSRVDTAPGADRSPRSGMPRWAVVVVRGRSMAPTLLDGDRLLVRGGRAAAGRARPGRLAVVRLPGGRPLAVKRLARREDGGWWVERDNPLEGVDSWAVGAVPDADLLAIAVARLWPRPGRRGIGRPIT